MTNANTTPPAGEVEKVIERLTRLSGYHIDGHYPSCDAKTIAEILTQAASLLTTYAEDNERLRAENKELRSDYGKLFRRCEASEEKEMDLQAQAEEMRKALEEADAACGGHALDVGFVHGEPTRKDLQQRLDTVRSIARTALMKGGE